MTAAARRILVVEDEAMIAMLMEEMLADMGHQVVGVAPSLAAALQMAREADFDLAILDVNIGGKRSFEVAQILADRGMPFMFATGYGASGLEGPFENVVTLRKPFQMEDLAEAVNKAVAAAA